MKKRKWQYLISKYNVSVDTYTLLVNKYRGIRSRCNHNKGYKDLPPITISLEDMFILWNRDKAYLLKKPSIDRKDNNKGYTFDNCRFIELSLNIGLSSKTRAYKKIGNYLKVKHGTKINQLDLSGKIINTYCSCREAGRQVGVSADCIIKACKGKFKTSAGYKWQYV